MRFLVCLLACAMPLAPTAAWASHDIVDYQDRHAIVRNPEGLRRSERGDDGGPMRVLGPVVAESALFGDIRLVEGAAYYALGDHVAARYEWGAAAIDSPPQAGYRVAAPIEWTTLNLLARIPR